PSGSHQLIQNCSISCGDDNIAVKAGIAFCSDLTVADCQFGRGHGLSIGGQSNRGLDGLLVEHCTFRGTLSGLRLKADATQGGPVRHVRYTDLQMSGVAFPLVFYSYYNRVGNPGRLGRQWSSPEKAEAWNRRPPNPLAARTLPSWRDIAVENLTADDIGAYSVIWGLPLRTGLISDVRLRNVRFAGGPGLELYDAANVQFLGDTRIGPVIVCNALALTSEPASRSVPDGSVAVFEVRAVGGAGIGGPVPRVHWTHDGAPLMDGPRPDGAIVSGAGSATLRIARVRGAEAGAYRATVSTELDGFDLAAGHLDPRTLPATATSDPAYLAVAAR
ncbi:MAG: glycosyl hydrolase family 28 protein, partial [Opitutaceae bacterium]